MYLFIRDDKTFKIFGLVLPHNEEAEILSLFLKASLIVKICDDNTS